VPVTGLSHYLVRANDVEATKRFYVDVLGFEQMPRPDLPFPGYWLGVDGDVQVHIAQHGVEHARVYYIGSPAGAATNNTGVIDHIAFVARDPQATAAHFDALRIPYRRRYMEESKLYQLFVEDPNGLMIELNFFGINDVTGWSPDSAESYSSMPR
jgi:catechol 2,3-dioxygenase-like lactoylglutathione lyase family enzyme